MKRTHLFWGIGICAAVLLVLEILLAHPHSNNWWHTLPGVDLVFGFAGCCALIFIAKKLLAPILQRPMDYYEESLDGKSFDKSPAVLTEGRREE